MRVERLQIRRAKALEHLDHRFEPNQPISVLYGANGCGKSTILDVLSLLGHLHCMARVAFGGPSDPEIRASHLRDWLAEPAQKDEYEQIVENLPKDEAPETFRNVRNDLRRQEYAGVDEEDWYKKTKIASRHGALVRFVISHGLSMNDSNAQESLQLSVYCSERLGGGGVSLSQALSRQSCDDWRMNDLCVLFFDHEIEDEVNALLKHLRRTSPSFLSVSGDDKGEWIFRKADISEVKNAIVAVNTDLNDFGRQNQVRESVKDLKRNLKPEVMRLGIEFDFATSDGQGELKVLEKVNASLKNSFGGFATSDSDKGGFSASPLIQVTRFSLVDGNQLAIRISRREQSEGHFVDFMSSGENEAFFLFLLLHGLGARNSLVLLDEPELHIGDRTREKFFEELYRVLRELECQVIIATHCLFAYTGKEDLNRYLVRHEEVEDSRRCRMDWRPEFDLQQCMSYTEAAFMFLGGGFWMFLKASKTIIGLGIKKLRKEHPNINSILLGLLAAVAFMVASSVNDIYSDVLRWLGVSSDADLADSHLNRVSVIVPLLLLSLGCSVLLAMWLGFRRLFRKRTRPRDD